MSQVEQVLNITNILGEGPLWVPDEKALYWVDIDTRQVFRYYPATNNHDQFTFHFSVTVLGMRAKGGFVLAHTNGFAFWKPQPGEEIQALKPVTDPEANIPDNRFNDGAVDRQGRFWAGTMNMVDSFTPTGSLYRLDPDRSVHKMETGVNISNGCAWSPDNETMYFTPTGDRIIWAYDFDPDAGSISNRRIFVEIPKEDGYPDGHTVDSQGCLWTALWGGSKISCYDPDGKKLREIPIPAAQVTRPAFGGENLDELYITSAWTGLSQQERAEQPQAGGLFRVKVDVAGLPEPKFTG